jgi:hypothetical protein
LQHELAGVVTHAAGQPLVAQQLFEALMQRRDITRRSEKPGLAIYDNFGQAANATRDDRRSRGHGF